ncbi:probable mannosyltransferase Yur1p [Diutina catenulata]
MYPFFIGLLALYYYVVLNYHPQPQVYNGMAKGDPKPGTNAYIDIKFPKRDRSQLGKENATIVMLVRNEELDGALESIRSLEDRFNRNYRYPWVFMNDVAFTEEFKERTKLMVSGEAFYEVIPRDHWNPPPSINETRYQAAIDDSMKNSVLYGWSRSYRNMCRFNSGFFYKQKRLLNYKWYFRVEPDVEYMCDFQYDPFRVMREKDRVYGFAIAIHEFENTIPTLWPTVEHFMEDYPHLLHPNNSLDYLLSKEPEMDQGHAQPPSNISYNLCHFWSNFEIASLDFFRSEAYETFFNYLDSTGNFYYERWGDAPVHSIAVNLLADKHKVHHFEDIGYFHAPYMACPSSETVRMQKRCICKAYVSGERLKTFIDTNFYSCLPRWWRYGAGKSFKNEIDFTFNS